MDSGSLALRIIAQKREYEIRALRCPRKQKLADLQIRKKIRIDSKLQLAFFILSPARETCCVLSIWMLMHSCGLCPLAHQPYFPILQHCGINVPPDRLLRRSADNYFMLYLAESLTGRSYTEGKLLRYFPLWRERGNDDKVLSSLAVSP